MKATKNYLSCPEITLGGGYVGPATNWQTTGHRVTSRVAPCGQQFATKKQDLFSSNAVVPFRKKIRSIDWRSSDNITLKGHWKLWSSLKNASWIQILQRKSLSAAEMKWLPPPPALPSGDSSPPNSLHCLLETPPPSSLHCLLETLPPPSSQVHCPLGPPSLFACAVPSEDSLLYSTCKLLFDVEASFVFSRGLSSLSQEWQHIRSGLGADEAGSEIPAGNTRRKRLRQRGNGTWNQMPVFTHQAVPKGLSWKYVWVNKCAKAPFTQDAELFAEDIEVNTVVANWCVLPCPVWTRPVPLPKTLGPLPTRCSALCVRSVLCEHCCLLLDFVVNLTGNGWNV